MPRQYSANDFSNSLTDIEQTAQAVERVNAAMRALPSILLMEVLTGAVAADGVAILKTTKPFTLPPVVIPLNGWSANQLVCPYTAAVTAKDVTVKAKRSKGTLLLTAGPFEDAAAGTPVSVLVLGV